MHLTLLAVAREAKRDPLELVAAEYLARARSLAPSLGLKGPESRFVVPARGNDPLREADSLRAAIAGDAVLLDERGALVTSEEIAALVASRRDAGSRAMAFCIGGADGFDPAFREEVQRAGGRLIAFGRTVWPHALCRTMLAEQLYRALAILAGHPYHRGG